MELVFRHGIMSNGQAVAAEEEDGQADDTQERKKKFFCFFFFLQTKYLAPVSCRMITEGGLGKGVG